MRNWLPLARVRLMHRAWRYRLRTEPAKSPFRAVKRSIGDFRADRDQAAPETAWRANFGLGVTTAADRDPRAGPRWRSATSWSPGRAADLSAADLPAE